MNDKDYNMRSLASTYIHRYKISLGLVSALIYLYEEWDQWLEHWDTKPSNVMLHLVFNSKLGDLGLANFINHEIGSQTTVLAWILGYLGPEGSHIGRVTKESDVYSFAVVALEYACARKLMNFAMLS